MSYGCESRLRPHPQSRRFHRRRRSGLSSAARLSACSSLLSSLPLYVLSIFVSVDPKYCMLSFVLRVLVDPERKHSAMSPLTAVAISAIVYVCFCVRVRLCIYIEGLRGRENSGAMCTCIYQGPGESSPRICLTSGAYGWRGAIAKHSNETKPPGRVPANHVAMHSETAAALPGF